MAVLVKDGKILTIDGKTIKAPTDGGSNVPLFAPTLTASDKTITLSDTQNGAFANKYSFYMNNTYIGDIGSSLDITLHLNDSKDTNTFKTKASGLLKDSAMSNGINYHKVLFKNQDDTLLQTQMELENEVFKYDGEHPVYEGNFYGWHINKDAVTRINPLIFNEPTTLYAIYTHEFADAVEDIGTYSELSVSGSGSVIDSVLLNNKIYVLVNNKIYAFNPNDKTVTEIGELESRRASVYNGKICTLSDDCKTLSLFDVEAKTIETISLQFEMPTFNIPNYGEQQASFSKYRPIQIVDNKLYFILSHTLYGVTHSNYCVICYDLTNHTYEKAIEFIDVYMSLDEMLVVENVIWLSGFGSVYKCVNGEVDYPNIPIGQRTDDFAIAFSNGYIYISDDEGVIWKISDECEVTQMGGTITSSTADVKAIPIGNTIYFISNGIIQKYY